jgi:hypothetical protein
VVEELSRHAVLLPSAQRRVLAVVQALMTGGPLWNLGDLLYGLDRPELELVLAALSHAAGGHEAVDVTFVDGELTVLPRSEAELVPWPADGWAA